MQCDQCEMLSINGLPCHESGCPNMRARWDGERWIKQRKCGECGCTVDASDPCCNAEEKQWSGSCAPEAPADWWIDDDTGEYVRAATGERMSRDAALLIIGTWEVEPA